MLAAGQIKAREEVISQALTFFSFDDSEFVSQHPIFAASCQSRLNALQQAAYSRSQFNFG